MDNLHRENILKNIDDLIEHTDYKKLMSLCVNHGIINDSMKAIIEDVNNEPGRHRLLLEKITRRGPMAYAAFETLLGKAFPEAHKILQNGDQPSLESTLTRVTNSDMIRSCLPFIFGPTARDRSDSEDSEPEDDIQLAEYQGALPGVSFIVQKSDKIYRGSFGTYTMASEHRGVAFIVNIIDFDRYDVPRRGAEKDRINLITLLREMGFTVYYYENLTKAQFSQLIKKLIKSPSLRRNESLILGVLSHGRPENGKDLVEFKNHDTLSTDSIIRSFSSSNCPALIGKPKIFLFPFCRGDVHHIGITHRHRDVETDARVESDLGRSQSPPPTAEYCDIIILYATLPGYVSNRHVIDGSHYIDILCEIWAQHAHNQELGDLMKMIDQKLRERIFTTAPNALQVTSTENRGFNRALYFNPGYVDPARRTNST